MGDRNQGLVRSRFAAIEMFRISLTKEDRAAEDPSRTASWNETDACQVVWSNVVF